MLKCVKSSVFGPYMFKMTKSLSFIVIPSLLFFVPLKYDVASHSLAKRSYVPSPECVSCSKHIEYCFSFSHVNI